MEDRAIMMGIIAFIIAAVLIGYGIAAYFRRFNRITRYLAGEMRHADGYDEYRHWRRELRCHYLCLIPFVTERNVMRLYPVLFHRPRHEEKKKRSDGFFHILAPSVVGLCLCLTCLCGMSWAWFTASTGTGLQTITTPRYTQTCTVSLEGTVQALDADGCIDLSNGSYTVTLRAEGDDGAAGYCRVTVGDTVYYTVPVLVNQANHTLEFTIEAEGTVRVSFAPVWGSRAAQPDDRMIQENEIISVTGSISESPAAESSDTKEEGQAANGSEVSSASVDTPAPRVQENAPSESESPSENLPDDVSSDTSNAADTASSDAEVSGDGLATDEAGTESVASLPEMSEDGKTP